jgi:hypothetical protein
LRSSESCAPGRPSQWRPTNKPTATVTAPSKSLARPGFDPGAGGSVTRWVTCCAMPLSQQARSCRQRQAPAGGGLAQQGAAVLSRFLSPKLL